MTLGRWPTVDLRLARVLADAARKMLVSGRDPVAERRVERAKNTPSSDTMLKLFEAWMSKSGSSVVYRGNIEAAFQKDVFPALGTLQPHKVTRGEILTVLRSIEGRGAVVMVRRVRMWLRQMFEYAIEDEQRPLVTLSPVPSGILRSFNRGKKGRHFAALTKAGEVPGLMRCIRGITDNFVVRVAFLLSAHAWQRPTEIREAVWEEFDLEKCIWVIPAERMKLASEHWVPLSKQVVALLRVHQGVVGTQGLLFPGRVNGSSISEGTLSSRLNTMGYQGRHTPHGFRAMARTILDEHLRVDPRFIEKQLSHDSRDPLRGAYNRAEYWEGRVAMMHLWSDWLDAQI
jgi:integrase